MSSKIVEHERENLAKIVLDAVKQIAEQRGDLRIADIDQVQMVKKEGKSLLDTRLVNGVIIDKEVANIEDNSAYDVTTNMIDLVVDMVEELRNGKLNKDNYYMTKQIRNIINMNKETEKYNL